MEFLDEKGKPRVLRAGRFGVGAFAIFLLGPSFRLSTRHASADRSMGYSVEASADSQLIEIHRTGGLPVGTTIEVELASESAAELDLEGAGTRALINTSIDWFCWDWPKVTRRHVMRGKTWEFIQKYVAPLRKSRPGPEWSVIYLEGFDAVYWTFGDWPSLMCNGFRIGASANADFQWPKQIQLSPPSIAVLICRYQSSVINSPKKICPSSMNSVGTSSFPLSHTLLCAAQPPALRLVHTVASLNTRFAGYTALRILPLAHLRVYSAGARRLVR
jgi:hypothetical protein